MPFEVSEWHLILFLIQFSSFKIMTQLSLVLSQFIFNLNLILIILFVAVCGKLCLLDIEL